MKKITTLLVLTSAAFAFLSACNKSDDSEMNKFSFEFNGQTYTNPDNGGYLQLTGFAGITIKAHGILGGDVYFDLTNCAFMVPVTISSYTSSGCAPDSASGGIDRLQVYYFKSGFINYSYSACIKKRASGFGGTFEYEDCTVSGSFALTLKNGTGHEIGITKGSFIFYRVNKY